jgi:hypothetical protein
MSSKSLSSSALITDKTVHKKIEVLETWKKDIFISLQNMQQWMIGGEKYVPYSY